MKGLFFNFVGYGGLHSFLAILPKRWQTRIVAREWLKNLTTPDGTKPDPTKTPMVLQMPWGSFRLISVDGRFEPCKREHFQF